MTSSLPLSPTSHWSQEPRQNRRRLLPIARFAFQLLPAGARELVELCFAVVLGNTPLGTDVAFLFEFEQRRIDCAVVHGEPLAAGLLDAARDAIAVERPHRLQGLEHHQGQRALPDL